MKEKIIAVLSQTRTPMRAREITTYTGGRPFDVSIALIDLEQEGAIIKIPHTDFLAGECYNSWLLA